MKVFGNSKPVRNRTTIFSVWWEKPTLSFWRKFYCHILSNQIKTTYLAKLWTLHPTHDSTLLAQEPWGAGGFRTTLLSKSLPMKNFMLLWLASQDALEVMRVTHWVTHVLTAASKFLWAHNVKSYSTKFPDNFQWKWKISFPCARFITQLEYKLITEI